MTVPMMRKWTRYVTLTSKTVNQTLFMNFKRTLATMTTGVVASLYIQAQNVEYPDYGEMKDSIGTRLMRFYMEHKELDMARKDFKIDSDLNSPNILNNLDLPAARKRRLDSKHIYPLCKPSVLGVGQVDFRTKTNDFYLDIFASAAVLTADGVCISNYHVFEDLLTATPESLAERHFIRMVIDKDSNVYPIKSVILADSINDFSVFTVDTHNRIFTPIPLGKPVIEGEEIYCISHPKGNLYYLTKGIVARNQTVCQPKTGQAKLEMQITADYAVCSSGGPIIDSHGNLVGIVGSTLSLYASPDRINNFQMAIKKAIPVKVVLDALHRAKTKQ